MATKSYLFKFGTGDPRTWTGLSPTFLLFFDINGATQAPPSIAEAFTLSGYYKFTYNATLPIGFLIDGATSSLDPIARYISSCLDPIQAVDQNISSITSGQSAIVANQSLMIAGQSNLIAGQSVLVAGFSILVAGQSVLIAGESTIISGISSIISGISVIPVTSGNSALLAILGSTASSYGSTVDPVDIMGYLKRLQEFNEGDSTYLKSSNQWLIYTRGSSALLALKTLVDSQTQTTKS